MTVVYNIAFQLLLCGHDEYKSIHKLPQTKFKKVQYIYKYIAMNKIYKCT